NATELTPTKSRGWRILPPVPFLLRVKAMTTPFGAAMLARDVPRRIREEIVLPRRSRYHPSPVDWRDELLYFLLVDRFSDAQEDGRPLLDRRNRAAARPKTIDGEDWRWDLWAESGAHRWQGGTIKGVQSKLD